MSALVTLAELDLVAADESVTTLYLSDVPMRPVPAGDPDRPGQRYLPILLRVPSLRIDAFVDLTRGIGGLGVGELQASNGDGALNAYRGWPVRGVRVRRGRLDAAGRLTTAWAGTTPVLTGRGTPAGFEVSTERPNRVTVGLYDGRADLRPDLQSATFAGTNTGSDGYEGTPETLQGQPKPVAIGDLEGASVPAVWANRIRQVAQVNAGPFDALTGIYDRGQDAGLANAGDYSDSTFDNLTLSTGEYATDRGRGLVLVEANLSGPVTFGLRGDASGSGYVDTVPAAIERLLDWRGVPAGRIGSSFASINAPQTIGLFADQRVSTDQWVNLLCRSILAWCLPDANDVWQIGLLRPPAGNPVATWDRYTIRSVEVADRRLEAPAWSIEVRFGRNWRPLGSSEIAPALTTSGDPAYDPERAEALQQTWRRRTWQSQAVKDRWGAAAREIVVETALVDPGDADALLTVLADFHGVPRQRLRVVRELDEAALARQLGDEIHLDYPAQGVDDAAIVLSREIGEPRRGQATFEILTEAL